MGGWNRSFNHPIMLKEFAVALGTLATPLAPPLDKGIIESVVLMKNLPTVNSIMSFYSTQKYNTKLSYD